MAAARAASRGLPTAATMMRTVRGARARWRYSDPPGAASGVDAAQLVHGGNAADGEHVGRRAHVHLVLPGESEHVTEAARHDLLQTAVDRVLRPEVAAAVLHPLEVGHGHAASVREDVGDDEDPLLVEDRVGARRRGAVRTLADDARLHLRRVLGRDD